MSEHKPRVMFLCSANACRSQMAEAILRKHAGDRYEACSAGVEPADQVHPLAVQVMREIGIDISQQRPKPVTDFLGRILLSHVITVCDRAATACPTTWPGPAVRLHWSFEDPAALDGPADAMLAKFREVRDKIEAAILSWLAEVP